jgi:hypothetical protein
MKDGRPGPGPAAKEAATLPIPASNRLPIAMSNQAILHPTKIFARNSRAAAIRPESNRPGGFWEGILRILPVLRPGQHEMPRFGPTWQMVQPKTSL